MLMRWLSFFGTGYPAVSRLISSFGPAPHQAPSSFDRARTSSANSSAAGVRGAPAHVRRSVMTASSAGAPSRTGGPVVPAPRFT